jgi:hypothetical protein
MWELWEKLFERFLLGFTVVFALVIGGIFLSVFLIEWKMTLGLIVSAIVFWAIGDFLWPYTTKLRAAIAASLEENDSNANAQDDKKS